MLDCKSSARSEDATSMKVPARRRGNSVHLRKSLSDRFASMKVPTRRQGNFSRQNVFPTTEEPQ